MSQHLHLPCREAGWPLTAASYAVAGGSEYGVHGGTVQASSLDLVSQPCGDRVGIESFAIRPRFRPCVVAVGNREHPPFRRE
jgi:hypothetical protein